MGYICNLETFVWKQFSCFVSSLWRAISWPGYSIVISLFSVKSKSRFWQKVKESCCCRLVFNTFSTYEYERIRISYNKEQIGWVSSSRQCFQSKRWVCRRSVSVKFEQTLHAIPPSPHLLCAASCIFNSKITPMLFLGHFWNPPLPLLLELSYDASSALCGISSSGSIKAGMWYNRAHCLRRVKHPSVCYRAFGRWHSWMALETALRGRPSQRRVSDDAWFPNLT